MKCILHWTCLDFTVSGHDSRRIVSKLEYDPKVCLTNAPSRIKPITIQH